MQFITNAEAVTSRFGGWPSFHDAEIVSLYLTREGERGPVLETVLSTATNRSLVRLRFSDVREDIAITSFNHQNVISSLVVTANPEEGTIAVAMPSLYGADVSFTCSEIAVISVADS